MTIQLSISVWTVICFILLMVILHNLLFKPVLQVMDKRRERIKNAAAKKAEYEKMQSKYKSMLTEKKSAFYDAQKKQIKDEIEAIRSDSKKAIEMAQVERLREVDDYRADSEIHRAKILESLNEFTPGLAAAFADSLTKE